MIKILEYFIRKIKGENFTLDKEISIIYILNRVFLMVTNLIRGNIKTIFIKKKSNAIFIGRRTKLIDGKKICFGNGINIGDNVIIDALSKNGILIGNNVRIGDYSRILCTGTLKNIGKGIKIGNNFGCGENCFFGSAGGIEIGNDVIMGQDVRFHSENHNFSNTDVLIRLQGVSNKGIYIGNNCWIGSGVVFLDGAELNDGCVVAANAVVTKKFPQNCVIGGIPAKIIKQRGK